MKALSVLGSTGSIGVSTLQVVAAHPQEFSVTALAAGRNVRLLREQIERFRPRLAAVIDEEHASRLRGMVGKGLKTEILAGMEGYREAAAASGAEMVVSAMVGAAGLLPTLEAIEAGKDIALANKETLVMAGRIVLGRAAERGVNLIPVDSEHSAVFQCLQGHGRGDVRRIILTASGGPFLRKSAEEMGSVTAADALRHPNWAMGKKITIDSATMINKGLEVIEAMWLFGLELRQIDVLIHPQSIVHSLVEYRDGSMIAQLGMPDMKVPIAYALSFPHRLERTDSLLNLSKAGPLEFSAPDHGRFPALRLAYEAAARGGTAPAVLNAANEIAVEAFLDGRIGFGAIVSLLGRVLAGHGHREEPTLEEILAADRWAREETGQTIRGMEP